MRDEHGNLAAEKVLVRTDSAGASREFLHHLHELGLQFSTSFALPVPNERFIHWINDKEHWENDAREVADKIVGGHFAGAEKRISRPKTQP